MPMVQALKLRHIRWMVMRLEIQTLDSTIFLQTVQETSMNTSTAYGTLNEPAGKISGQAGCGSIDKARPVAKVAFVRAQPTASGPLTQLRPMPIQPKTQIAATPTGLPSNCSNCHLRELCLPCGMTGADLNRLDDLHLARRRVKAGGLLYRQGDPFEFVYAVRGGTLKSSLMLADGREQVSGFHMSGEQLGLDGVAMGRHGTTVTALEDTEVCAIPYVNLARMTTSAQSTEPLVSRLMSQEIIREHSLVLLLGSMNAEERLATFLLNLAGRLKARGYSGSNFNLRMTRAEIGSHLGLKLETVSRLFSAFQKSMLLQVDKRHIQILNPDGLTRILGMRLH